MIFEFDLWATEVRVNFELINDLQRDKILMSAWQISADYEATLSQNQSDYLTDNTILPPLTSSMLFCFSVSVRSKSLQKTAARRKPVYHVVHALCKNLEKNSASCTCHVFYTLLVIVRMFESVR